MINPAFIKYDNSIIALHYIEDIVYDEERNMTAITYHNSTNGELEFEGNCISRIWDVIESSRLLQSAPADADVSV